MTYRVGIIGGTGYTGSELSRILCRHPDVELAALTSRTNAGKKVSSVNTFLKGYTDIEFTEKISDTNTKTAFREAAHRYMPEAAAEKKKLGFPVPIRIWLRQEKYYNIVRKAFLSSEAEKFFHTDALMDLLDAHFAGREDYSRHIWTVYTFLVWYRQYFVDGACAVTIEDECLAPHVACQLGVSLTVADDIAGSEVVVLTLHVLAHHASAGFACGSVILRKMSVDELFSEMDTLGGQCLEHQVMDRPERLFRKGIRAQSVLVGHHDQFKVGLLAYQSQIAEDALLELQLLKSVDLLI